MKNRATECSLSHQIAEVKYRALSDPITFNPITSHNYVNINIIIKVLGDTQTGAKANLVKDKMKIHSESRDLE